MDETNHRLRLLQVYRDLYFHELERKEKIVGRLPWLLAIYSLLTGIGVSYLNNMPRGIGNVAGVSFIILLAAFGSTIIWSAYYAVRFLVLDFRDTAHIRTPEGIAEYEDLLREYTELVGPDSTMSMDLEMCEFLIEQYGDAASRNFHDNKDRHATLGMAVRRIILATCLASASAVPYFYLKLHGPKAANAVEIVNIPMELTMKRNKSSKTDSIEGKKEETKKSRLEFEPGTNIPKKPKRPGILLLRDSETVAQHKARRDDGVW